MSSQQTLWGEIVAAEAIGILDNPAANTAQEEAVAPRLLPPPSPKGDFGATRPCIGPAQAGHEIQRRQQVSASGTYEAVVQETAMQGLRFGLLARNGNDNNRRNVNANQQPSNRLEMAPKSKKTHKHVFEKIASFDNLLLASRKARKGKTKKPYVEEFEKDLDNNLYQIQLELLTNTYQPGPLTTFTVRDPKTRKISASPYRDRIVHHAVINVIGPIFESRFIHDTYANRLKKGNTAALNRFEKFMRQASANGRKIAGARNANEVVGYALKADISKYFENVDHQTLLSILRRRIKDELAIGLVQLILDNHKTKTPGKGMPLGNLTSQFLANVYLGELDEFVKHNLNAKFYIRYVDDFVILSRSKKELAAHKAKINSFLAEKLQLSLHAQKTQIVPLKRGLTFLGFREFYHFRLPKKSNQNRIYTRIEKFRREMTEGKITPQRVRSSFAGWRGYVQIGDTFRLREKIRQKISEILGGASL